MAVLATRPGKVRILIGRTHRPTLEQIAAGLSAGDTLALLANGGVRQGCLVDAGLTAHPTANRCTPERVLATAPVRGPVRADPTKKQGPRPSAKPPPCSPQPPAHSRSAGATSSAYSRIDRCTRSAGTVPPKLGSIIKPVSPRSARMLFRRSATISGVPYATRSASRSS